MKVASWIDSKETNNVCRRNASCLFHFANILWQMFARILTIIKLFKTVYFSLQLPVQLASLVLICHAPIDRSQHMYYTRRNVRPLERRSQTDKGNGRRGNRKGIATPEISDSILAFSVVAFDRGKGTSSSYGELWLVTV